MKYPKTTVLIVFALVTLIAITSSSCKKKAPEEVPEEEVIPPPPPYVPPKSMSAKVNGQNWNMRAGCWETNKISPQNYFYFSGYTAPTHPSSGILLGVPCDTGVFLINSVAFAQYKSLDGIFYTAKTGTVQVLQLDTAGTTTYNYFKAKFSFSTDTINGNWMNVSDGVIDFEK
ncbi:MAG: hypothetical protein K0S12_1554 [Bacteroidetes bacterium]|jgi:hypothetical protein|nr:hypothetical protein [Bacteroidota bacterium]